MLKTTVVVAVSAVDDAAQHLDRALAEVLVQHQEEERVDEGVDEADVERDLVRHRVLGLLPVARVVGQSHLAAGSSDQHYVLTHASFRQNEEC